MGVTILVLWFIGIIFSWVMIWYYKYHWLWCFIMIPLGWCGFLAMIILFNEKIVDLYNLKNKKR